MRFRKGAQLDTSQVSDVRGRGGAGRGIAVGGGGIGLVGVLVVVLLQVLGGGGSLGGGLGTLDDQTAGGGLGNSGSSLADECQTAQDANSKEDCRIVGYVNSIQRYWTDQFQANGKSYELSKTVFFNGQVDTGCTAASEEAGPRYWPAAHLADIELGVFAHLRSNLVVQ